LPKTGFANNCHVLYYQLKLSHNHRNRC